VTSLRRTYHFHLSEPPTEISNFAESNINFVITLSHSQTLDKTQKCRNAGMLDHELLQLR
jgi:hypothetical protein